MQLFTDYPAQILILLFLIVTFLQSGIDKIVDWKGNVNFITSHFKNSPLKNSVPLLLFIILVLEVISGVLMAYGIYEIYVLDSFYFALIGAELACLALIFLLIGQRLAKDYAGAMTLAVYFIIAVFGVFLLNN